MEWRLDHGQLVVALPDGHELRLTAPELVTLVEQLANLRGLLGLVPQDYALGQVCDQVLPGPRWVTEPEAMNGDSLIHIRDPRYGWLHYLFPRVEAAQLGEYLKNQAALPVPLANARAN